jgi:hypothetical protein
VLVVGLDLIRSCTGVGCGLDLIRSYMGVGCGFGPH